jgi:hypothetical protein
MRTTPDNPARVWFQRVLWLGIAANLALALPTLVAPARMLALVSLPPAAPLLWTRFAAWLLVLLSAFYVPAAIDADRFRTNAWLAVGSRLAGVVFFLTQPREYLTLGLFDGVFFVPEAILLTLAARRQGHLPAGPATTR